MVGGRTTTRHKADNTFKFDTFADKLSKISVNVWADFRGDLSRGTLDNEDDRPHFLKCVEKWSELDLSAEFTELVSSIGTQIQTLAQIIHNARKLADTLFNHITVAKKECLPATLELTTALSIDLGKEFQADRYRFIKQIVDVVTELKSVDGVEVAFKTLAYMLKHGKNEVNKSFAKYFILIKPLLESPSVHFQVLGCQSFSRVTSQRWNKVGTQAFFDEIMTLVSIHDLKPETLTPLFHCLIRGPWGKLTLDADFFIYETFRMCFLDHECHLFWKVLTLNILDKLFDDPVLEKDGFSTALAHRILVLGREEEVIQSSHFEFYFHLLLHSVLKLTKRPHEKTFDSSSLDRISEVIDNFLPLLDNLGESTTDSISNILILLARTCPEELLRSSKLIQITIKVLRQEGIEEQFKSKILNNLLSKPDALRKVISECGKDLPPSLSPLILLSDLAICMRKNQQPIGERPQYVSRGICTAIDVIKETSRSQSNVADELHESFGLPEWPLPSHGFSNFDSSIRQMLCLADVDYSTVSTHYFGQLDFEPEHMDHHHYFQHLLILADGLHKRCQSGYQLPHPHGVILVINKLVGLLATATIHQDRRELWILKSIDFLIGALAIGPREAFEGAEGFRLDMSGIKEVLPKYLRSGYVVFRCTAASILFHLASYEKMESLTLAWKKCLELELWNMEASAQEEINKLMEDLIGISRQGDLDVNIFLMSFALGFLFSKYEPVRKQCIILIQTTWSANITLGVFIGEILKHHADGFLPPLPKCLEEIDPKGKGAFEKYEASLFDIPSVGYVKAAGFSALNYPEYYTLVWSILASYQDLTNTTSVFKTLSIQCGTALIKKHMQDPPYFGFKILQDGVPPKFLPSIISWIGRCSRFSNTPVTVDHELFLTHFLMSSDPAYRKAAIGAAYNMDRRLEKYRDGIEASLGVPIVSLTEFSVNAAEPIIKDDKERSLVMKILLPLIGQKFMESVCSKRKFVSRSQKPILIGLMGFQVEEVKRFIELIIGASDIGGFKKFNPWTLNRSLRFIYLMLFTWKHTFPTLVIELQALTIQIVKAAYGEDGPLEMALEVSEHPVEKEENEDEEDSNKETEEDVGKEKEPVSATRLIYSSAFRILNFVYENFPIVASTSDVSMTLMTTIIAPQIEKLIESSTGSVSAQLRFLEIWTRVPRFRHLLVRFLPGTELVPMTFLYKVLTSQSTSIIVKLFVFNIFLHLLPEPEPEDVADRAMPSADYIQFEDDTLSLETNILRYGKDIFLNINDYIPYTKIIGTEAPVRMCQGLFQILQRVINHSTAAEIGKVGVNLITNTYLSQAASRCHARVDYWNMIREIIKKFPNNEKIVMHLSKSFSRKLSGDEQNALISMLDGYTDEECKNVLLHLFARDPTDLSSPDYERRAKGWSLLQEMFQDPTSLLKFDITRFTLIGNVMMGILKHDTQGAQMMNAIGVFTDMKNIISNAGHEKSYVEDFMDAVFMKPTLAQFLRNKPTPQAFENLLRVIRIYSIDSHNCHPILDGLISLTNEQEDLDILCGLVDIQVNNRTKAMNRLLNLLELQLSEEEKKKPFRCFGEKLLLGYLVPLATFCIQSAKSVGKAQTVLDNLVDSSIKVYRAAAQLLTPKQYIRFLDEVLFNPPEDLGLLKRFKRQILAILGGFRYSLVKSSECSSEDTEESMELEVAEEETTVSTSKNLIQVEDSEVEGIIALFRPVLDRLSTQICNFSRKRDPGDTENLDYSLMAECTLGVAKLLQRFPPSLSNQIKDKLVPDICACMKSKEHKVRLLARNTLKTLMSVRTEFISFGRVLSYLKANLKVGFQKHVLNHSLYAILSSCEARFTQSPQEVHIKSLVPLCEDEFFGVMEEEKGIGKITEKTAEARAPNAKNILTFCAKISQNPVDICHMISSGLDQLRHKRSEKNVSQVKKWLEAVHAGLTNNTRIDMVEVLRLLELKLEDYKAESRALSSTGDAVAAQKDKIKSALEIKPLPAKNVRDTLTTEMDLLLLFQYKIIYNYFRCGNQHLRIASDYYHSAVVNLNHTSNEIMLLSHRLIAVFLSWDQGQRLAVPHNLLPGGADFDACWNALVLNVVKFCDRSTSEETVNVIFSSVTTFLCAHPELKLKSQDLTVLLSTVHRFICNGHCVSAALKFLNNIIERKLEVHYIQDLMEELLKIGVRSTTSHVVDACQKVYLNYLMVYGSARRGGLDNFLCDFWTNAKNAEFDHEAENILTLVLNIIQKVPPSSFINFFQSLPVIILEMAYCKTNDIQNLCFELLNEFLDLPDAISLVLPFAESLMARTPQQYHPIVVVYLFKVFNKITRNPNPCKSYLKQFSAFILELMEHGDTFRDGMRVGYQQFLELIEGYVGDGLWNGDKIKKWRLKKLIQFIATNGVGHSSGVVKSSSLGLISILMQAPFIQVIPSTSPNVQPKLMCSLSFLRIEYFEGLLDSHFSILEHSKSKKLKEKAAENLEIFVQLICHLDLPLQLETDVRVTDIDYPTYVVDKIKRIINEEVTQRPDECTLREIGYRLLRAYVHLVDSREVQNSYIGKDYERRKGPLSHEILTSRFFGHVRRMIHLGIRDVTDGNVKDELKKSVESFLMLIRARVGSEIYNMLESEMREILHTRRRQNKAKKAETAVNFPGIPRKRSKSSGKSKDGGPGGKKPKRDT